MEKSWKRKKEKEEYEDRERQAQRKKEREREREVRCRTQPSTERLTIPSPSSHLYKIPFDSPCPRTCSLSPTDHLYTLARTRTHTYKRVQKAVVTLQRPAAPPVPPRLVNPRSAGVFPPSPCFRGPFQPPRSTPCPAGHVPIHRRHAIVRSIASRSVLATQLRRL